MATTRIRHRAGNRWCGLTLFGGEVSPVHSPANPQDLKNGSRTVQSVALETPPHTSRPQYSRLPVWPSPRRPWPPPCSVLQGWGVGQKCVAESAVAQICREGGVRVSTNVMLWDLDTHSSDGRRLEVVAEGLCLFGGCQLALDATVVSTLHGDGTHRRKADVEDGVALKEARRSKEATYPELCRGDGGARLVVIAGEVGGRWSQETKDFLWCLACEKSKASQRLLQGSGSGLFSGWAPRIPGVR